jgi:predicted secreted protein
VRPETQRDTDDETRGLTQPGNKLSALFGNVVVWCTLMAAVLFGGWALTVLFHVLTG